MGGKRKIARIHHPKEGGDLRPSEKGEPEKGKTSYKSFSA